ncbi:hypothetical protein CYMTET_15339 [Cymbomonas tetramitiformis]|uniref:Uncharacterized protein n=1 Tax=Cymbomonas tetramitiformis TaxID=36881 RepID=A0AAE0GEN5_9CHLO|nr:hypothetical protein CYMTET_15339 [Cymbomonas tetramitiformis]
MLEKAAKGKLPGEYGKRSIGFAYGYRPDEGTFIVQFTKESPDIIPYSRPVVNRLYKLQYWLGIRGMVLNVPVYPEVFRGQKWNNMPPPIYETAPIVCTHMQCTGIVILKDQRVCFHYDSLLTAGGVMPQATFFLGGLQSQRDLIYVRADHIADNGLQYPHGDISKINQVTKQPEPYLRLPCTPNSFVVMFGPIAVEPVRHGLADPTTPVNYLQPRTARYSLIFRSRNDFVVHERISRLTKSLQESEKFIQQLARVHSSSGVQRQTIQRRAIL